jgi:hypothetical protein
LAKEAPEPAVKSVAGGLTAAEGGRPGLFDESLGPPRRLATDDTTFTKGGERTAYAACAPCARVSRPAVSTAAQLPAVADPIVFPLTSCLG